MFGPVFIASCLVITASLPQNLFYAGDFATGRVSFGNGPVGPISNRQVLFPGGQFPGQSGLPAFPKQSRPPGQSGLSELPGQSRPPAQSGLSGFPGQSGQPQQSGQFQGQSQGQFQGQSQGKFQGQVPRGSGAIQDASVMELWQAGSLDQDQPNTQPSINVGAMPSQTVVPITTPTSGQVRPQGVFVAQGEPFPPGQSQGQPQGQPQGGWVPQGQFGEQFQTGEFQRPNQPVQSRPDPSEFDFPDDDYPVDDYS